MTQDEIDNALRALAALMSEMFGEKANVCYYRQTGTSVEVGIYANPAKYRTGATHHTLSSGKLADPVSDVFATALIKAQSLLADHRARAAEFGMLSSEPVA